MELAALPASAAELGADVPLVLVVAADADVRAYVSDSLRTTTSLAVIATGSVGGALDVAVRRTPRALVVSHGEQAVVRHLPGVPAVLLSDEAPAADVTEARRLAPLVMLRGAFRAERLLEVVVSLMAGYERTRLADTITKNARTP